MKPRLNWLFLVLLASPAFAQLELSQRPMARLLDVAATETIDDVVLVQSGSAIRTAPVVIVTATTEAANIQVDASDINRNPVAFRKLSGGRYLFDKPGRVWVDVTAIDFAKNIFVKHPTIVVEIGGSPTPAPPNPPGPTPVPPNPPTPVPDVIPNAYGVGEVAYRFATNNPDMIRSYQSVYGRAGDFLFGVPSLKFVTSSRDADNNNPERSVNAWIRQQLTAVQCPDVATCQAWTKWREQVNLAVMESQRKRQFSRQDWWNVFNEISTALSMVK
jgi:hypothetical protein